ncbi:MAG TPA: hypothetical protein VKA63_05405 [Candidatus Krumholzibacteria bacterium]|nr:hypothetical protein [Candidatus Krumholzibacteria bacterium]
MSGSKSVDELVEDLALESASKRLQRAINGAMEAIAREAPPKWLHGGRDPHEFITAIAQALPQIHITSRIDELRVRDVGVPATLIAYEREVYLERLAEALRNVDGGAS